MKKLVIVMILVASTAAFAEDLFPPDWRGEEYTTFQEWTFSTGDLYPLPYDVDNPYGDPRLRVDSCFWLDEYEGHFGVWTLSGQLDVYIPNYYEPRPDKFVRIQLTWMPGTINDPFLPNDPLVSVTPFDTMEAVRENVQLPGGWIVSVFDITIHPNPIEEWFAIKGNILVDQLVIDTYCPEPATMLLLGLGGLAMLRKRKS